MVKTKCEINMKTKSVIVEHMQQIGEQLRLEMMLFCIANENTQIL